MGEPIEIGAMYRDTATGWEGTAIRPDEPQTGKTYRLDDGTEAVAVGPCPGDPTKWVVYTSDAPDVIDRARLPLPWPRVGLIGRGPKGAAERRYANPSDLELIDG